MNINGDFKATGLNMLAQKLLSSDEDKVITKQEIKEFAKTNEAELVSLNIDMNSIEDELSEILSDNMEKNQNAKEVNNNNDKTIKELKAEIKDLKEKIKGYDTTITTLNDNIKTLNAQLKTEQNKYEQLEEEAKNQNKKLETVISSIDNATKAMKDDMKHQQKKASLDAVANYNPERDGDWDEYIQKSMSKVEVDSGLKSSLSRLLSKSDFLQTNLSSLANSLSSQASKIQNLNLEITATQADISNTTALKDSANSEIKTLDVELKAKIAAQNVDTEVKKADVVETDCDMKPSDVMNLISSEEKSLIESNNIDLTEKLDDGSPRYVFAKGAMDNQYHVYDMGNKNVSREHQTVYHPSIPRLYGNKSAEPYTGCDICPAGNGYLSTIGNGGDVPEKYHSSGDMYFIDDCDTTKQYECCCYSTASPLAFDLEGDGVKTSKQVIDYDIDGDGKLDKINDSADAVLVFDKDGDGISGEDGSEAFGNNTDLDGDGKADGYKDGFEALKALAKKEGLIDGKSDNKLDEKDLKVLQDKYGLGIKKDGYLDKTSSLSDVGITEINLATTDETTMTDNFDGMGNQLMTQKGATFKINGETREYADIWHKKLNSNDIELLDNNKNNSSNFFNASSLSLNISDILNDINTNMGSANNTKIKTQKFMKDIEKTPNIFLNRPAKTNIPEQDENQTKEAEEKKKLEEEMKKEEENNKK